MRWFYSFFGVRSPEDPHLARCFNRVKSRGGQLSNLQSLGGGCVGGPDLVSPQVSITEVKGFVLPLCFDQLLINSSVL